ncbi:glycosyltransferase family 2 protein [Castellaniella ginsengisoli]|uniref:Glycosyltransferase family 2 protein n=1 Tax=Castellaniella ginsengisoli TaxID=546114 RepID=A0AB39ER06_9BURK
MKIDRLVTGKSFIPMEINHPLVICLPIYNEGPYIEDTLLSVKNQTCRDFRVLIADNASSDDTESICRRVIAGDDRFHYVRHDSNIGAAANFKYCFEHTESEFFMWLGGHDQISPNFLQEALARMRADSTISLVYGRTRWIDEEGKVVGEYNGGDYVFDAPMTAANRYFGLLKRLDRCEAVNQLIRRKYIDLAFRPIFSGDVVFLCHLAAHGPFSRIEKAHYIRREFLRGRSSTAMERVTGKAEAPRYHEMAAYFVESICGHAAIPGGARNGLIQDVLLWMDRKYSIFSGNQQNLPALVSRQDKSWDAPFFSVVMPVYNREAYLEEAMRSVLSQGFDDFELIISDDGSTDKSLQIAESFDDPRIRILRGHHGGGASARNRGLAAARGEFIVWIDSDDIQESGALATLRKAIHDTPDADVFYGDLIAFDDGDPAKTARTNYPDYFNQDIVPGLFRGNMLPNPGTAVRKALYDQYGDYDVSFRRCHDYQIWTRLAETARFKKVDAFLCRWRQHGGSLSSTTSKFFEGRVVMDMFDRYPASRLFPDIPDCSTGIAALKAVEVLESLQEFGPAARMMCRAGINGLQDVARLKELMSKAGSSFVPSLTCLIISKGNIENLSRVLSDLEKQVFHDFNVYVIAPYDARMEEEALRVWPVVETIFHTGSDAALQQDVPVGLLSGALIVWIDESQRYPEDYLKNIYTDLEAGSRHAAHIGYVQ